MQVASDNDVPPEVFWSTAALSRLAFLDGVYHRDTAESTRQKADEEFEAVHLALYPYKTLRNAIAPVSRLPPEILARIFFLVTLEDKPQKRRPGWVRLTWVCCHWRTIALECAALWCRIDFQFGKKWADEFLARAKSSPITFMHHFSTHSFYGLPDYNTLILQHLSHTKEIELRSYQDYSPHDFFAGLSTPAPLLEKISFVLDRRVTFPAQVFNNSAPRLRHIKLRNVAGFPWAPPYFLTNLVSFSFEVTPDSNTGRDPAPTLDIVLAFLGQSPALQVLSLVGSIPPSPPDAATGPVTLPHLAKLTLGGVLPHMLRMMKYLAFPPSATVELALAHSGPDGDDAFASVFTALSSHLGGRPPPECHVEFLCDDRREAEYVHGEFHIRMRRFAGDTLLDTPALIMSFNTDWNRTEQNDLMQKFFQSLPPELCMVRQLAMKTELHAERREPALMSTGDWVHMVHNRQDVREIYAEMDIGATVCAASGMYNINESNPQEDYRDPMLAEDFSPDSDRVFLLPKLQALILYEVDFDEIHHLQEENVPLSTLFSSCLKARKAKGCPLDSLELKECMSASWDWLDNLAGIVRSVERKDYDPQSREGDGDESGSDVDEDEDEGEV
ncbi:hypothetical protein BV25DRAFT_1823956 [Artomyces pyxidatus]|uniref:Uncharacterized protein n=1 Tax=Artomyces pyxidatus TaxID=48021 RepID=A0ACB8T567_9AGAM|nr:hypothetical protein BV25DRAFT_1823956 [Artomyces pyxidatus]